MKFSRDSLPDRTGPFTTALVHVFWATTAGTLYAIIVFLIGFILGTVRVLLVVPHLGETTAVIVEAPIMLAGSWFVCGWCVDRLDVRRTVPTRSKFAKAMLANPDIGVTQIAHRLGVSPATLYRYIPAARTANSPGV